MRKFLAHGSEVEVHQQLTNGQLLVENIMWDEEIQEEIASGELRIVNKVYDRPPMEKVDAELKAKQERLKQLSEESTQLLQKLNEAKAAASKELKLWEQHKATKRLNDYLEGKITHYVIIRSWTAPEIVKFADAKCDYDEHKQKLLTLFGDPKCGLQWRLSHYSDGSGGSYECVPCLSEQEAIETRKQVVLDAITASATNPRSDVVKWADAFGVEVPEDYRKEVNRRRREGLESQKAELYQKLAVVASDLASLPQ